MLFLEIRKNNEERKDLDSMISMGIFQLGILHNSMNLGKHSRRITYICVYTYTDSVCTTRFDSFHLYLISFYAYLIRINALSYYCSTLIPTNLPCSLLSFESYSEDAPCQQKGVV